MNEPLFMVVGPQGAGKTTFGKMLAEELGTAFNDTSKFIVLLEIERQKALKERYGITPWMAKGLPPKPQNADGTYDLEDGFDMVYGWDDVRNRPARELLVALGNALNNVFPAFLYSACFAEGRVAAGLRGRNELEALRSYYQHNVKVIFIDRDPGPQAGTDRFELTKDDADYVVRAKDLDEAKKLAKVVAHWRF